MTDIYILIFIFVLILVNGFFAASEMAMVSVNPNKILELAQKGNKKAIILKNITVDSTKYLSAIQVAITLAGFLSSAIAGSNLANNFVDYFAKINIVIPQNLAVVIITILLSFITLVFGELVPKKIALNNPVKFALFSARAIKVTLIITKPAVWLLSITTTGVVKLFGLDKNKEIEGTTESEIRQLIRSGQRQGLYQKEEKEMLENIFRFDDIEVTSIMTPRTEVFGINLELTKDEILDTIIKANYSRIPVYEKTIDNIKGIIHVKDVLTEAKKTGLKRINYKKLLREPFYVPGNMKINFLFKKMQEENHQIAVILDNYGGIDGIITMEDILEEIVGNIYDEFDEVQNSIKEIDEFNFLVDGLIQIQDLNRFLNINLSDEYDTLSGFIIENLGYIPKKASNEIVEKDDLIFEVKSVKKNRIDKVLIKRTPKD
ncbi:MAG: hemolysin family protein [Candidatus Izemoplasmatales bacterium]|nr:hemolysin family protein [Candidatus Izemoplasmatales bacterium]MDD4068925.1 hemolysin family protein [Candidatus Izemoplasmatales bacterium]MDY0139421.1 hemolysin family protein [Candidatus Izemoplasmatales bacterium]